MPTPLEILVRSASKAARPIPAHFTSGALPLTTPPDARNFPIAAIGAAAPQQNCAIAQADRIPIGLQLGGSCAFWNGMGAMWATIPATMRQTLSPRAGYVWGRMKMYGVTVNWQADNGVTAPAAMWTFANKGLPSAISFPLDGPINEVPSTNDELDASFSRATYYACPALADIQTAILKGLPVFVYLHLTADFYFPEHLPDGSFEVDTPTANSAPGPGHFVIVVAIDWTRKMLDGTIGGMLVRNCGWLGWGNDGEAWLSIAGWIVARGNAGSQFALVSNLATLPPTTLPTPPTPPVNPQPPEPTMPIDATLTLNYTPVVAGGTLRVTFTTNADNIRVTDDIWHGENDYRPNESFVTGVVANQTWTFTALRAEGGKPAIQTITIPSTNTPAPTTNTTTPTRKPKLIVYDDFSTGPYLPNL